MTEEIADRPLDVLELQLEEGVVAEVDVAMLFQIWLSASAA